MQFETSRPEEAGHGILAHSVRAGDRLFKKGHVISADDVSVMRAAGVREVVIARLEDSDIPEDVAAARIARKLAGENVRVGAAFTGRANLFAEPDGLSVLDAELIDTINAVDESITVATLSAYQCVSAGQMLATVKIIPFAAPREAVETVEALLARPALSVRQFRPRATALVLTTLPDSKSALLEKTRAAIRMRLQAIGSELIFDRQTPHTADALAPVLREAAHRADLILVFGASAIADRRDVIPAAIEKAGGSVEHFGMPVDPGNLLLIGRLDRAHVVGLPGCARSPKLNGFDFVLWRLAAGLPVGRKEIVAMGVGGLLMEIPTRPQPRDEHAVEAPRAPRVAAIVLAAGSSHRMGTNKLLAQIGGKPMVCHVVDAALASAAAPVLVVTGNERERVRGALEGYMVQFIENPEFASGLSSSLKRGLSMIPGNSDAAVILLGDMPGVNPVLIDKLIAAFNPAEGRAICVATHGGKRGNPVLFARRFFAEIAGIEGDVGARGLIGAYPDMVCDVEAGDDAPLIDIDTPEALAAYLKERR